MGYILIDGPKLYCLCHIDYIKIAGEGWILGSTRNTKPKNTPNHIDKAVRLSLVTFFNFVG